MKLFSRVCFVAAAMALHGGELLAQSTPMRVLFIGNSQLYYYDLPMMVQGLSDSASPARVRIESHQITRGRASLKMHCDDHHGHRGDVGCGPDCTSGAKANGDAEKDPHA